MKLDPTISSVYTAQQQRFARLIRMSFTIAGCYWIVIYVMNWLSVIDHDQLRDLRSGQTLIYFVLLSLWGVEYLREVRRLKVLIATSEELARPVSAVTLIDIASSANAFSILAPTVPSAWPAWIFPILNIGGLIAAATLIIARYAAAFAYLL